MEPTLICAELRAAELLACLRDAVAGAPKWRSTAGRLLREIDRLELTEARADHLREIDHRKRMAEIIGDLEML